jgi:HD-like signal output (HDOD) protein
MAQADALNSNPAAPSSASAGDADPLRTRLSRILEGGDFPALSRQIIDTLGAMDDDAASLQRLANVVLREYSLTLSVVRTANSVHYRRGARPIQSATHAMMMLGARTVRQLAGSLLLFENYARKSPELKELMLLSLLTANHARATALRMQLQDPEEAHLCGMFRNLGEVIIAAYFPEDYRQVKTLMTDGGLNEAAATKRVLGFQFNDLGVEVSRHWGMPDSVVQGIRARATASASMQAAITAFSHDLTQALYKTELSPSELAQAVESVVEQHGAKVKMSREQIGGVVTDALEETRELFVNPAIATDRLRFRQLAGAARSALGDSVTASTGDAGDADLASREIALRPTLRQELEEMVNPASGAAIGAVLLQALEVIMRGGPFAHVLACFYSTDRLQLAARTGLGEGADALIDQFNFPVSVRGGAVVALTQQRQPVYLPADRAMTTAEQRWAHGHGLTQFGVFPLIVLGKVVGCLYVDRASDAPLPDRATVRFVKSVADLVVDAIGRRRNG